VNNYISNLLPKLHELMVPKGTILLTRSGTLGIPILVWDRLSHYAVTDDALRIFAGEVPFGYIYAFLASKYGYSLMTKSAYGSTVEHLEAKHLTTLPVPIANKKAQATIHEQIVKAYSLRDQVNDLLDEADELLHNSLGLHTFNEKDVEYLGGVADPKVFTIDARDLGGRFDAGNHVPYARSAIHMLQQCKVTLSLLGDAGISVVIPARFKRNYVEAAHGVRYLVPSQIVVVRSYDKKCLSPKQAAESPEYLLKTGELLISTDGTIGRLHLVTESMKGWFGSNNLARLSSDKIDMGFLYAFLSTPFGQHQICKEIYGGVIDHINEKHLKGVLIPLLSPEVQRSIGDLVRKAFSLKDQANRLEDQAIAKIEEIIEGKGIFK
jgi:type I restriction enzyme S subunit